MCAKGVHRVLPTGGDAPLNVGDLGRPDLLKHLGADVKSFLDHDGLPRGQTWRDSTVE